MKHKRHKVCLWNPSRLQRYIYSVIRVCTFCSAAILLITGPFLCQTENHSGFCCQSYDEVQRHWKDERKRQGCNTERFVSKHHESKILHEIKGTGLYSNRSLSFWFKLLICEVSSWSSRHISWRLLGHFRKLLLWVISLSLLNTHAWYTHFQIPCGLHLPRISLSLMSIVKKCPYIHLGVIKKTLITAELAWES